MAVKAFILVNIEPTKTRNTISLLTKKEGVTSAVIVAGRYDAVVQVEAKDIKSLSEVVIANIRTTDGVRQTETLVVTE